MNEKQKRAVELLAAGASTSEAAAACGVSSRTIRRWRAKFAAAIERLTQAELSEARRYLHRRALAAARALVKLSESGRPQDRRKLEAVLRILDKAGVTKERRIQGRAVNPIVLEGENE